MPLASVTRDDDDSLYIYPEDLILIISDLTATWTSARGGIERLSGQFAVVESLAKEEKTSIRGTKEKERSEERGNKARGGGEKESRRGGFTPITG